jgi:ribonuclease HI
VLKLFIDGSVDAKREVGYGAYLVSDENSEDCMAAKVCTRHFEEKSSVRLELRTLLWAFGQLEKRPLFLTVYTDSQNIISLSGRRAGLESNAYRNTKGRALKNKGLYLQFFKWSDDLRCTFVKVKGHQRKEEKKENEVLFTQVDRAARKALRDDREV